MAFQIVHHDLTKMKTDAIVNAANSRLRAGGGVCGAIFQACGHHDLLQAECDKQAPCPTGEARITKGYDLPAKYIVHTVGPIWQGGKHGEEQLLRNAYYNALKLAAEHGCESISFPLISAGIFGYPKEEALGIAMDTCRKFLMDYDMEIYLVVFNRKMVEISEKLFHDIEHYIDVHYEEPDVMLRRRMREESLPAWDEEAECYSCEVEMPTFAVPSCSAPKMKAPLRDLDSITKNIGETFSQMLLRLIDERGLKDSEVYTRANIDRKHFSKIRNKVDYHPSKANVFAFAVALELSLDETLDLLNRAGYGISKASKFDVIMEFLISEGYYDIDTVNQALFQYGMELLGTKVKE